MTVFSRDVSNCFDLLVHRCSDKQQYGSISFDFLSLSILATTLSPTLACNLRQNIGEKFPKLGKISFSIECVTADFLQFLTKKRQNLAFGWKAG